MARIVNPSCLPYYSRGSDRQDLREPSPDPALGGLPLRELPVWSPSTLNVLSPMHSRVGQKWGWGGTSGLVRGSALGYTPIR